MTDATLIVTALLVVLAALVGPSVPWIVMLVALVALLTRHPLSVVVALVLIVAGRSHASATALDAPLPERIAGTAELVADPSAGAFGTTVELRLGGRRWQAQVPRSDEWVLRPLLTGDRVVVAGRPRPFHGAPEGWRRSRHLAGRLRVTRLASGPRAPPWYRVANEVHRLVADGAESFPSSSRSLYLGLVLGDDRGQSDLDRFRFQATGLGHLLAVSGQNVAFLMVVARPVLSRCTFRTRWVVGLVVLVLFVLVTRAEASVLRAAAMTAVALLASTSGRVVSGARILALAVIGLLLVDPLLAAGLGFQLSVCATIGLLVGVRPISARIPGPRWFTEAFASTVSAQVATAPLLVDLNGGVPSVATLANVVAVPVAGLVMMAGLTIGLVAGTLVTPVAAVLNAPARVLVGWIELVAAVGSRMPFPLLGIDRLALVAVIGLLVLLGASRRRWTLPMAAVLAVAVLMPVSPPPGRTSLGRGVDLFIDDCGRRSVELTGRIDVVETLGTLHRVGVVSADTVVGTSGAGAAVAEQLGATFSPTEAVVAPCTVTP